MSSSPQSHDDNDNASIKEKEPVLVLGGPLTGFEDSHLDEASQRRLWRKLDIYVLPLLSLLYLLSFMWVVRYTLYLYPVGWLYSRDRANIGISHRPRIWNYWSLSDCFQGNARIAGMVKDLDLYGLRYNIAAAVFFVSRYAICLISTNRVTIDSILFCWSTVVWHLIVITEWD